MIAFDYNDTIDIPTDFLVPEFAIDFKATETFLLFFQFLEKIGIEYKAFDGIPIIFTQSGQFQFCFQGH